MSIAQTSVSPAWLSAFLAEISLPPVAIPADFLQRFSETIQGSRIYIENLRSLLDVSTPVAKALLDIAACRGLLKHNVLLLCPNDDCSRGLSEIALEAILSLSPGEMISCEVCEGLERDQFEFPSGDCRRLDVYQAQDLATGE